MSPPQDDADARRKAIARVVDEFFARLRRGEDVNEQELFAAHPDLMPELAEEFAVLRDSRAEADQPTLELRLPGASTKRVEPGIHDVPTQAASDVGFGFTIPGYVLTREISRGGQGIVFQGLQSSTNRKVAIKILRHGPLSSAEEEARFTREAQVLAALRHPHIVSVFDCGKTVEGAFFMVMEYVSGRPLDRWLLEHHQAAESGRTPSDPAQVLRLFMTIADAVNAAHLRGIVHRDLKPSNIHIDHQNEPRILDFGLVHLTSDNLVSDRASRPVTITGQFLGSLPWASPEQAEGIPSKIDCRTDVYSLGVILYQMLTGQFPYEVVGNMRDVLDNIMRAEPSPPSMVIEARLAKQDQSQRRRRAHNPGINATVDAIVLKALHKNPADRYENAGDLSRDIGNYLSGRPTIAGGPIDDRPSSWRRPLLIGAGVLAAAAITGLAVHHFEQQGRMSSQVETPTASTSSTQTPPAAVLPQPEPAAEPQTSITKTESQPPVETPPAEPTPREPAPAPVEVAANLPAANEPKVPVREPLPSNWHFELDPTALSRQSRIVETLGWLGGGSTLGWVTERGDERTLLLQPTTFSGSPVRLTLPKPPRAIRASKGRSVVMLLDGREVSVWEGSGSTQTYDTSYASGAVATGIAWNSAGNLLATASSDGQLRIWARGTRGMKGFAGVRPKPTPIVALEHSPALKSFVVAVEGNEQLEPFSEELVPGEAIPTPGVKAAWLRSAHALPLIAIGQAASSSLVIVDLKERQTKRTLALPGAALAAAWSHNDQFLAVTYASGDKPGSSRLAVYRLDQEAPWMIAQPLGENGSSSLGGAWSLRSNLLACPIADGRLEVWQVENRQPLGSVYQLDQGVVWLMPHDFAAPKPLESAILAVIEPAEGTRQEMPLDEFQTKFEFEHQLNAAAKLTE